jgi:hypothetical protein
LDPLRRCGSFSLAADISGVAVLAEERVGGLLASDESI